MKLSVVIPALNEAGEIGACLRALAPLRSRGHEAIVADGGSDDGTPALAKPLCARVATSGRRWERRGVLRTIFLMWRLRLLYFFGARPEDLAVLYRGEGRGPDGYRL